MNRRHFISSCCAGMAASTVPLRVLGRMVDVPVEESWAPQFQAALKEKPWLAGYQSIARETFESDALLTGRWPEALRGTLYRNGPARHEIGNFRYHHWFDGDGMLQSFNIGAGKIRHRARMIQTHKYREEKDAGRALYSGFASVPPNPRGATSADAVNVANISVLPHHGKLLTLWEAGSAWEMDPDTLDTLGPHSFSENSSGVPFSAHPRVEPDGTLWNFGYVSSAKLMVLWHIDKKGQLVNIGKIPVDPISMPHDFIVTEKHIVLMVPPFHYQPRGSATFLDAHHWQPELPTRILVVDKNDFSRYRWLELPSQWVFHFGNGWEDESGIIRFDGARASDPLAMTKSFREIMRGVSVPTEGSRHTQYRIDTRSWTVSETPLLDASIQTEFPVIDPRVSCRRYRRLVMLGETKASVHGNLNEVRSLDLETGKSSSFRYPDHQMPEEHLLVPRPGSATETRGWVLGTVHDWQAHATRLNLFDVEAIDAGPIATATLPYALPLGLHGKFLAD